MLELFLIRHGQTQWNLMNKMQGSLNSDLTALGENQAKKLSKTLAVSHFDKVYSSTTTRAIQSSKLIFQNQDLQYAKALQEIAMGEWEGKTYSQIEQTSPQEWYNFFHDPLAYRPSKGGETFNALKMRLKQFIADENLENLNGRIAIVSHRITIKMLISLLIDDEKLFNHIDLDPTSLSVLVHQNDTFKIKTLNNTAHYK